jgi:histidine triad (HIT) family protein
MTDTIFQKIIDGDLPADIIYEDEQCLAFRDINPIAPTHILIIPKTSITQLNQATETHQALLGHLLLTANTIAKQENIEDGYRVIINNGQDGGQSVFHLHLHLIGGKPLSWPNA